MSGEKSLFAQYFIIFLVVSGYWIVSIATVFVNKKLLSDINLDAPLFIIFYQTLTTVLICLIKKALAYLFPEKFSFPDVSLWKSSTIKAVLPLSLMFTAMIATNNLCLKYTSVAFYYVGRSLTTIFNVLFTFIILGEKTSKRSLIFCLIIVFGFILGIDQENLAGSLTVSGTFFGIMGSITLSLFSIFTKKVLPSVQNQIWALSYCNNVYASILFIPLMLANGEFQVLIEYQQFYDTHLWFLLTIGGVFGFLIGFFTSLQIKYTSPLTHNISGTAKACAQTVLATYWYKDTKSVLWWCSNFIVLFGSAGYARVKQLDMEKQYR